MLGFLPSSDEKDKYAFRVTNNVITSQTMGATVKGLYPNLKEHSAWIQPSSYDSLEPAFCESLRRVWADFQPVLPAQL